MEQGEEVRNDTLDRIGHEYLVAIELYAVLLQIQIGLYLGEVEYTGQMEGEINVQMYPEQGLVLHGIEFTVEIPVVLILELARCLGPQGFNVVDDVVLVRIDLLTVLPLLFLAACYLYRQETAVFLEQCLD